jgi:5'-methylthioadenosine phosphorylase
MNTPLGLIATTGLDIEPFLSDSTGTQVVTRYGDVPIITGRLAEMEIAVVCRHGGRHPLPPGQVNYRAYTLALRDMGVTRVLSTLAVGSLRADILTGTLVSPDQFLDFTKHRVPTLFDESGFAFTDMSQPYCSVVRRAIASTAPPGKVSLHRTGCYVGVDGPRYETAAEVAMFARNGGTVIGHTGVTEAVMLREAGLCHGAVGLVTNPAAGIGGKPVSNQDVRDARAKYARALEDVVVGTLRHMRQLSDTRCDCPPRSDIQMPKWHAPSESLIDPADTVS